MPTTTTIGIGVSETWYCPPGVTSISVQCWGGGGCGGQAAANGQHTGGGGGGEYAAEPNLAVTPGRAYAVTVASGTPSSVTPANGGNTVFPGDNVTVTAHGGKSVAQAVATGGAGGTGSTNTVHFNGGAGATSTATNNAGGGGSSAGTSVAGNPGTTTAGGAAPVGGYPGAAPPAANQIGIYSPDHSGGGSGVIYSSSTGTLNGGGGGTGLIYISFTTPSILYLTDTFTGTALKPAVWSFNDSNSRVSSGQLQFVTPTGGAFDSDVSTLASFDLTGGSLAFQLVSVGTLASNSITIWMGNSGSGQASFGVTTTQLKGYQRSDANVLSTIFTVTYSSVNHKWLRIREYNGWLYWESASDGATWTTLASALASFSWTSGNSPGVIVVFEVASNTSSPTSTTVAFDNVNNTDTLAGRSRGSSLVSGVPNIIIPRQLTPGIVAGHAQALGSLSVNVTQFLTGRAIGSAVVSGGISASANLRGQVAGSSRVRGRLPVNLQGFIAGHAGTGPVQYDVSNTLRGRSRAGSLARAQMHVVKVLSPKVAGRSTVRGHVLAFRPIRAGSAGHAQVRGILHSTPTAHLAGRAGGSAAVRGRILDPRRVLTARTTGHSVVAGKLHITTNFMGWGSPIEA